jgi:uncharacterized protein YjbI with pentapeptide repeats
VPSVTLGLVASSRAETRRWGQVGVVVAAAVVLAVVLVVVLWLPRPLAQHDTGHTSFLLMDSDKRASAVNSVRTTVLQALVVLVLAVGAIFTYRQHRVTREGQITDRYTKAVDQLGNKDPSVRLGGLYALERIARDSPGDRATVYEVISSYVRHRTMLRFRSSRVRPTSEDRTVVGTQTSEQGPALLLADHGSDERVVLSGPAPIDEDIQAALAVLGRRKWPSDEAPIDLNGAYLTGASLRGNLRGNLSGAELTRANLSGANLSDSDLTHATLVGADLSEADLRGASLKKAGLKRANLTHTDLSGADLTEAFLTGADLTRATLTRANLRGVVLDRAYLTGANLTRADLKGAYLSRAFLSEAKLIGANLAEADLSGADLSGADLSGADLTAAKFDHAKADDRTRWPGGIPAGVVHAEAP